MEEEGRGFSCGFQQKPNTVLPAAAAAAAVLCRSSSTGDCVVFWISICENQASAKRLCQVTEGFMFFYQECLMCWRTSFQNSHKKNQET